MAIHDIRYGEEPPKNNNSLHALRAIKHIEEDYTHIKSKLIDGKRFYYLG